MKVLISACLTGKCCRYDGASRPSEKARRIMEQNEYKLICPECDAGLATPRPPNEIVGGTGEDVLNGSAKVVNSEGADVTAAFIRGAEHALRLAREFGAERVYLKAKSPSCGVKRIYDGTFSGTLRDGMGVTAALLTKHGIEVTEID